MEYVVVRLLVACLVGVRYCLAGDEIPLDHTRAKQLEARQHCEIIDGPFGGPAPQLPAADALPPPEPERQQPSAGGKGQQGTPSATPLDEVGIVGKTADLLNAADPPLDTVEKIRAYLSDGHKLEDLDGIGGVTAKSIQAAVGIES